MNDTKHRLVLILSVVLFIVLFAIGIRLAQNKMLWNDELYSQVHSVEQLSYMKILQGKVPEGNNSPLFYTLQKIICDVMNYKLPFDWKGEWGIAEPRAQVILRLFPDLFMSLALTAVFYVFAVEYSLLAGIYAFLTALTTEMCWSYWAEARPYALWFCLSTVQGLCLLRFILGKIDQNKNWGLLGMTHILLSLTAVFGAAQAFIVSMVLYFSGRRKLSQFMWLLFVPLTAGLFYFLRAPHYVFGLPPNPMSLITENIPVDRFILIYLGAIVALGYCFWQRKFKPGSVVWRYGIAAVLMLAASAGIMQCLTWTADAGWKPFEISSRYFIFLAPVGLVTAAVFSLEVLKIFSGSRWMTINWLIIMAGFLAIRGLRVLQNILSPLGIC